MRFLLILWVRTYLDSWVKNQWMGGIWISHNDAWYCQSLLTPVVEGKADGSQYCVSVFILFMVWQSQRINAPDIVVGDTYHVILYTTTLPPSSCERWMLSSIKCCATLNYYPSNGKALPMISRVTYMSTRPFQLICVWTVTTSLYFGSFYCWEMNIWMQLIKKTLAKKEI